ncbi:hypothetical protein ACLOJK_029982 [Asimina triloba]
MFGWYNGGSIFIAVFLVVDITAVSNFQQDQQFQKLSNESSNIAVEVVRDRQRKISIYDVVVGYMVCLRWAVPEQALTSEHVNVGCPRNPFLFSDTKMADGYAQMLTTSVGVSMM